MKPKLGILGFFGRGNCGDEAIVQCIYEAFKDHFDIVIVVDEHGATAGWWNLYPYSLCERVHHGNFHYFCRPMAGLIVGGGGLGIGYGGSQALCARWGGARTALAGVDYTAFADDRPASFIKATADYYNLFDYRAMRSRRSVDIAARDEIPVNYGADWALKLIADESPGFHREETRVIVTLRHWEQRLLADDYSEQIRALLAELRALDLTPVFLPFCEGDDIFIQQMGLSDLASSERLWWNPRRAKQLIAMSSLVLSVGRLHPVILAVGAGVPAMQIVSPLNVGIGTTKLDDMANELAVPFCNIPDAINLLKSAFPVFCAESQTRVEAARLRLDRMIEEMRVLFLGGEAGTGVI